VKLLRVLESGRITRVGASEALPVDVRIVAATNRNPEEAVRTGKLRDDLFYRLNVFPIALPPLRDRRDDIELLAEHFLKGLNAKQTTSKRFTPEALERLRSGSWTGNVRELRNAVERAHILGDEAIGVDALVDLEPVKELPDAEGVRVPVGTPIAEMERRLIVKTLDEYGGNKKKAAEALGISLKTLYNRLNVYQASEKR
jgi:DNA-binding NtrC family response regulator